MKKRSFLSPYIYPGLKMAHGLHREIKEQSKSLQFSLSKDEVLKIISEERFVTVEDILSRSRKTEYVIARHMYCSILKKYYGYTLKKIGSIINRDHTSVIHSIQQFNNHYQYEEGYRKSVNRIYDRLGIQKI